MTLYESRTVRLDYDADSLSHKEINSSVKPSYFWEGISFRANIARTEGMWVTFTPASSSPAISTERRLRVKLLLTAPEGSDPTCAVDTMNVSWAITGDGQNEIASGFLERWPGQWTIIDREFSSDSETISLTLTAGETEIGDDLCRYNLRLEEPEIQYTGWWGPA